jgi:uncharacterized protein
MMRAPFWTGRTAVSMRVKIEEIRDEGLQLNERMGLEQLGTALEGSGFRATEPLALSAHLRKVSGGVLLKGQFTSRVATACKRCLTDAVLALPVSFTLNLVPEALARGEDVLDREEQEEKDRSPGENGGSFGLEDADEELFDGKVIDLEPILREQVLLALPMNAVCREDCQGLCPQCGQNRNEKPCDCEAKFVDPRFAALKNFKLQS